MSEFIGWASSLVLLLTIGRQVLTQWRSGSTAGMSRWLFIGQVTASIGFAVYSVMLRNWVFVVTNIAMLLTAICGQIIYVRNKRRSAGSSPTAAQPAGR